MPKVTVYDMAGKSVGEMELSESVFGVAPHKALLHAAVVNYLANQRQGTQSTLTRAEVSGGGKKPWRQKGTGHARQGSTRAPQWRHGGVALGPKPRSYRFALNRKQKRIAILSALSSKVLEENFIVVDSISLEEYKTKAVVSMLSALGADGKAMIVTAQSDDKVVRSAANIPGVVTAPANSVNVYDVLNCGKFIISKDAVSKLEEVYA
ncbi:MAG: 50S ribosomal protein L4 [Oscillospiraceae bacterium]|nr:50S ribosomal protein L4 [Oscillospiraceae bacterium]